MITKITLKITLIFSMFIIFVILSVIGLLINNSILYLLTTYTEVYYLLLKALATLVVMIYNFITRKIFLEKK